MNHPTKQIVTNLQSLVHEYKGNSWNLLQQSIKLIGFDLKSYSQQAITCSELVE